MNPRFSILCLLPCLLLGPALACGPGGGGRRSGPSIRLGLGPDSPPATITTACETDVVVLQLELDARGKDMFVESVAFTASGTGDDAAEIASVRLFEDLDADGLLDPGDAPIGAATTYDADDGRATFGGLVHGLDAGTTQLWLLVYDLVGGSPAGRTFRASLASPDDLEATVVATGKPARVLGAPVASEEARALTPILLSADLIDVNDNDVLDGPDVLQIRFSSDVSITPGTLADDAFVLDPPGTFGGGAVVSPGATSDEVLIEFRSTPTYQVNGTYPDPGADGINVNGAALVPLLDCRGVPVAPNSAPIDIGGELNPRVLAVTVVDVNSSGGLDQGDQVTVFFTRRVTIADPDPTPAFALPVTGDTLGTGAIWLGGTPPLAVDRTTVVLGAGAVLEPRGAFDPAITAAGSPSGIDVTATPGVVVDAAAPSVSAEARTPPGHDIPDIFLWVSQGDGQPGAAFGHVVASAGDVNGDGFDDIVVGAPFWMSVSNQFAGRAYLYHGGALGISPTPAWTSSGDDQFGAQFGSGVASAGDVDGDGFDDVIVGARYFDASGTDEGKAYVFHGGPAGLSPVADWTTVGDDLPLAELGASVSGAGDVDGDGFADVIVGAPGYDTPASRAGRAFVFHGGAAGLSPAPVWFSSGDDQALAEFGVAVSGAGDVDGDGLDDVIVGAPGFDTLMQDAGKAYLFLGGAAGLALTAVWTSSGGDENFGAFGSDVAAAGDVDADTFGDIIVGAWREDGSQADTGRAYVFLGGAPGPAPAPAWTSVGDDQGGAGYGFSVSGAGDVDDDGYDDVIVGAKEFDTPGPAGAGEGKAYVYHGRATGVDIVPTWTSSGDDEPGAEFGWAVSGAGDVDGNLRAEVIIGAKSFGIPPFFPGKAYVFRVGP